MTGTPGTRAGLPLRFLYPLYEFCFTPSCYHCQAPLHFGERLSERLSERRLCGTCSATLVPIPEEDPLLLEAKRRLCGDGVFDDCVVLYRFEKGGALQTLLHELKYGGKTGVGRALGRALGERMGRREGSLLLPIPLHTVRRRERGYNQSELICAGMADATGGRVEPSAVKRIRNTPTQTFRGAGERWENVHGAFALAPRARIELRGKEVVLVDDVITTGATLRACGAVVREAGAARLTACGVAAAALAAVS